jgi:hypothetical protein
MLKVFRSRDWIFAHRGNKKGSWDAPLFQLFGSNAPAEWSTLQIPGVRQSWQNYFLLWTNAGTKNKSFPSFYRFKE